MMIGDVLSAAQRSAFPLADWIAEREPELAERCAKAAGDTGVPTWLRSTVGWFEMHANGDDWANLTSRIRESEAPGETLLMVMVEKRLAVLGV